MINPDVLIIGAGPAGYVCAIRLGQLGRRVLLVDKDKIGGVCLNRGCIPTKALLHTTQIVFEAGNLQKTGVKYQQPEIDVLQLNQYIQNIPMRLRKGIEYLLRENKVEFLQADAKFINDSNVSLTTTDKNVLTIKPSIIIIANGSENTVLPHIIPNKTNIITSDEALIINHIPQNLVIIGAGAIGLEFATIYNRLGSKVKVIEIMPQILPGLDTEIANQLMNILKKQGVDFLLNSRVTKLSETNTIELIISSSNRESKITADKILLAVGRIPNTNNLGITNTHIEINKKNFIIVDDTYKTSLNNVYAIGDIIGSPLLAHKAMAQGVYLAEKIAGLGNLTQPKLIPNCIYTDPEIATVGLTELEANVLNSDYLVAKVPLSAIGRAHTLNRTDGFAKIIVDKKTKKILGAHLLLPEASNLINEFTLSMNADITIDRIIETIHPHPTLSEILQEVAASIEKKSIHILNK